jgi:hypothetical protein
MTMQDQANAGSNREVSFTPNIGHWQPSLSGPKSANGHCAAFSISQLLCGNEREALVRLVDDAGAEMRQASRDNRIVLF